MDNRCLHVIHSATVRGHKLPYRAHIRLEEQVDAIAETVEGVHIEFDHDKCTPMTLDWMEMLTPPEEQALYDTVSHEALAIYNMKRLRGERIDGESRAS